MLWNSLGGSLLTYARRYVDANKNPDLFTKAVMDHVQARNDEVRGKVFSAKVSIVARIDEHASYNSGWMRLFIEVD